MKTKGIYLDYAATTPMDPRVREAMEPFFTEKYGNPSSIHEKGREARSALENARETVARILHARPDEIIFTGGGTEAINLAIFGMARYHAEAIARAGGGDGAAKAHFVTTNIEHHAISHSFAELAKDGHATMEVKVNREGLVSPQDIAAAMRPETLLVSVMYANNEIGTIAPIAQIGTMLGRVRGEGSGEGKSKDSGIKSKDGPLLFTDACQAAGALSLDVSDLGVDMMALNGSKIYGPKGVGCLYVRRGTPLRPLVYGGGQERGWRSGTENVAGIIGFARALEIADTERMRESARLIALRDDFIAEALRRIPDAVLNGHPQKRLPNNINTSIPGLEGEAAVLYLDARGIYCSTGSACSAASIEPSHVITALGRPRAYAEGSLRLTLGRATTKEDLDATLDAIVAVVGQLRKWK